MVTTERPLTAEERESLLTRLAVLESAVAASVAEAKRVSRSAALAMLCIPAVFAAIALYDVFTGAPLAALIAGIAAVFFVAIAAWLARDEPPAETVRRDEMAWLTATLNDGSVLVHDVVADAALVIALREEDGEATVLGDILNLGAEVIYVPRRMTQGTAPTRLPNRHLRIVATRAGGILSVAALAEPIARVTPIELDSEDELFAHVEIGLVPMAADFNELARLLRAPKAPYR